MQDRRNGLFPAKPIEVGPAKSMATEVLRGNNRFWQAKAMRDIIFDQLGGLAAGKKDRRFVEMERKPIREAGRARLT